ncbi:hypothetical protein [uncultured Victivallis sp.]|uniref:hypothetical protein n=1 Tax=uncultured Victivallis sp. TaxID=354118 RepID=UPI0025EA2AF9|nr:hypothetical protein [uncultured Victivallis sp.]
MILILFKDKKAKTADETPSAAFLICRPANTARAVLYHRRRSADEENFTHSTLRTLPHRTKTLPKPATMQNFPRERSGISQFLLPAVSEMLPDSSGERVHKNTNSIFPETFQPAGTKFRVLSTSPPSRRKAGLTIIFPVPTGSAEPEIRAEILRGNFLHGAYNYSAARQNDFIADILCAGKHIEELRPVQLYCRTHGTIPSSLI